MSVNYEWDVEEVAVDGEDITNHLFQTSYADCVAEMKRPANEGEFKRIVLVRDRGNEVEGLICRSWAYMENGKLPEYFEDAYGCETAKVPQRFHNEVGA